MWPKIQVGALKSDSKAKKFDTKDRRDEKLTNFTYVTHAFDQKNDTISL